MYYVGVDGGGTKTAFVVIDSEHNVLASHETGTCYYIEVGLDGARAVLESGVTALLNKANLKPKDVSYAFFGLPAYGEDSQLFDKLNDLPSKIFETNKYHCDNDMVNGWAAAFGGKNGINIVAGTGSIAYGVKDHRNGRSGGWGEIFSDEGSGYWLACKGLQAFTKMSDGRSPKGPLYEIFKSYFALEEDLDITAIILEKWGAERSKIATLSSLVHDAALAGDKTAIAIFNNAAEELASMINSVRVALHYEHDEPIDVSYSGGIFTAEAIILLPLAKALKQYAPNYRLLQPLHSPVIGAAIYAHQLSLAL